MLKIHLVSDLNLGYNEFSYEDEIIPEVDIIIINGNISRLKRSMLYAETIANKYPETPVICNLGEYELYITGTEKYIGETLENIIIRKNVNKSWPKNLYFDKNPIVLNLKNGNCVDVLCTYGFPKIHSYVGNWEDTVWHQNIVKTMLGNNENDQRLYPDKPEKTSDVRHGNMLCVWADMEHINHLHNEEEKLVKKWELNKTGKKILITHINPYNDIRLFSQKTSPYLIHLNNGLWLTSNNSINGVKFLGSRLYSNPGSGSIARQKVIIMN